MSKDYLCTSAFVAVRMTGANAIAGYSVYGDEELLYTRCVEIPNVTEHRALLMATWSAVRYCGEHLPQYSLSVYSLEQRTGNELSAAWMGEPFEGYEDSDRIKDILVDCCYVASVAFGTYGTSKELARRMEELVETINR